jgi:hypothetical protein
LFIIPKAQSESKESSAVERPTGWNPTIDELDDYEKDIAKAYEKTGATEEEMKERWRERYVVDVQNTLEKEQVAEPASPDSIEGQTIPETGKSGEDSEQSDEFAEAGDGTASKMVMERPSTDEKDEENSEPESHQQEETAETETSDSEETSETDPETRTTPRESHTDTPSEDENPEPSEQLKDEYERSSQPTQFREQDRVQSSWRRVVDEVERSAEYPTTPAMTEGDVEGSPEPARGKVEYTDGYDRENPAGTRFQAAHETIEADASEGVHQHAASQSGDNPENSVTETQSPKDCRECSELVEDVEQKESVEQRPDEIKPSETEVEKGFSKSSMLKTQRNSVLRIEQVCSGHSMKERK